MTDLATCPNPACSQTWAVVPSIMKAHPGHARTRVTAGGYPAERIAEWQSAGPSALLSYHDAGGVTVSYTWPCLCGTPVTWTVPAVDTVPCRYEPGSSGVCRVRDTHTMPPPDRYVNPRHGAACPCCGHQGTHRVRRDGLGDVPLCLREVQA